MVSSQGQLRTCTVTVQNFYPSIDPRGYCVCASTPTIRGGPKIYVPVCYKTSKLNVDGRRTFRYDDEYYAFIGVRHSNPKVHIELIQKTKTPVKLGSGKNDGQIVTAHFQDSAPKFSSDQSVDSPKNTFTITCDVECPELPAGQHYVVGVAQKFDLDVVAIAAVDYKDGEEFQIAPAEYKNIRVSTGEEVGDIPQTRNAPFDIHIPKNKTSISIYEIFLGRFQDHDPRVNDGESASQQARARVRPEVRPDERQPTQQGMPRNASEREEKVRQQTQSEALPYKAKELGFTSKNQVGPTSTMALASHESQE